MQFIKKVFLFTGDHEGKNQKLRFFSQFYRPSNIDHTKNEDTLAELYILTPTKSYSGLLKKKNINKELAWNVDLVNKLQFVLSGKSSDLITYLEQREFKNTYLIVANQFQARFIRVILFEMQVQEINERPFGLMKRLLKNEHIQKQECLQRYKREEQKGREKMEEIDSLLNQISQNHRDEITLMKQMFIPLINEAKRKLGRCFGYNANEESCYYGQKRQSELQKLRRQFYKIKHPSKPNQSTVKATEMEHLFGMSQ